MVVVVIVIVALVLVAVGVAIYMMRGGAAPSAATPAEAAAPAEFRLRPEVEEFHVKGDTAVVQFAAPVPAGPVDRVLSELLTHEALEVVREKRHSLPIEQVTRVVAYGRRGSEAVEVGAVDLDTPGELPPPLVLPEAAPHASKITGDVLADYSAALAAAPGVAEHKRESELPPLGKELRLTTAVEAGLRAQGIDPAQLGADDLATGLLRLTGYQVSPGPKPNAYYATKAGSRTYVWVIPHESGSYPEVGSGAINQFMVDFVGAGAERGLLISDKFSPFEVYERERREPRVRFITRERLQGFVDALTVS